MSGAIKINGTSSGSTTITAPASGGDESIELSTALAAKGDVAGETWTGTHDFSGATVVGAGGKIVQIVRTVDGTNRSTTSTSLVDVTGMSVSITPSAATSKIILIATVFAGTEGTVADDNRGNFVITDNSNNAISGAQNGRCGNWNYEVLAGAVARWQSPLTLIGYHSPATTSATTYKLRFQAMLSGVTVNAFNSAQAGQLYAIEVSA